MPWFYYIYVYDENINIDENNALLCVDSLMKTFKCPVGLKFISGSAYEDPLGHTPGYIM